ncbi:MAG: tRNA 2-thiouridine(34) synthase MnmA [Gammaproteobacteria bacterium]
MARSGSTRVVVGMSGGVDSSVAALRLAEAGYDVHGLFMTNWEDDDEAYCTSARDLQDARAVCELLSIPLHRVNFSTDYRQRVFAHFLREYEAGRTPNPDVLCNREIKFGACFDYARRLGADLVATGHYACTDGNGTLLRPVDEAKDQTYFLLGVSAETLRQTLFPIGDLEKQDVRRIADRHGLPNHAKPDSTGICFIGERPFREFLARYLPGQPGDIVAGDGQVIGRHHGLMYYTIGQRQGLGIGGRADAGEAPWYVAAKDLAGNRLIAVQGHDHPALMSSGLRAIDAHWVAGGAPASVLRCQARIRHRQALQDCEFRLFPRGIEVYFDRCQRAVSPGQFIAFYRGRECLGGAIIDAPLRTPAPEIDAKAADAAAV